MKPKFARNAMKSYYENQAIVSLIEEFICNFENDTKKKSFNLTKILSILEKLFKNFIN